MFFEISFQVTYFGRPKRSCAVIHFMMLIWIYIYNQVKGNFLRRVGAVIHFFRIVKSQSGYRNFFFFETGAGTKKTWSRSWSKKDQLRNTGYQHRGIMNIKHNLPKRSSFLKLNSFYHPLRSDEKEKLGDYWEESLVSQRWLWRRRRQVEYQAQVYPVSESIL